MPINQYLLLSEAEPLSELPNELSPEVKEIVQVVGKSRYNLFFN